MQKFLNKNAVKKNKKYASRRSCFFFPPFSASKYKNAGSWVQRDDSSFRQRLHYSEGFREECGSWGTARWKGERNNVRGRGRGDGCSMESWKFHNGLWWARLKVHWRFSGRKDTESGWREHEAGARNRFGHSTCSFFGWRESGKYHHLTVNFPPLVLPSRWMKVDFIIPRIEKPNVELTGETLIHVA